MRHVIVRSTTLLFALALLAAPASAQIVQSLHLGGGVFIPKGYSSRATGDVLVADLNDLDFPKCTATRLESCIREEFTSGQVFGEWLVAFSDHLEVGAGLGFHSRSRPTVYAAYTNVGGSEIRQQLHLRVVPITGVVRFLAGHPGTFQPVLRRRRRRAELPVYRGRGLHRLHATARRWHFRRVPGSLRGDRHGSRTGGARRIPRADQGGHLGVHDGVALPGRRRQDRRSRGRLPGRQDRPRREQHQLRRTRSLLSAMGQ